MANTLIQLKRSTLNTSPGVLEIAEPAYSYVSNTLFLGTPDSNGVIEIGGLKYVVQQQLIYNHSNGAYNHANASFAAANNVFPQIQPAFNTANAAFIRANNSLDSNNGGTVTGDVRITGNLIVTGNTVYTNTQTLLVSDNIITLNAAIPQSGTPTLDAGIEIDRGNQPNTAIIWNETIDRWTYTNDGTLYANIGSVQTAFVNILANGTLVTPQSNNDTLTINASNGVVIIANDSSNTINISLSESAQGNTGTQIYVALNGDDNNDGFGISRPKRTVRAAVNAARPGMKVFIAAGTYTEITPIIVPQRVDVHGDGERSTIIKPLDASSDIFWLNNNCLITNMGFENYTGSACAFPGSSIHSGTAITGGPSTISLSVSAESLTDAYSEMQISITGGTGSGQTKTITSYNSSTKTATVDTPWTTQPDSSSVYNISIARRVTVAANTARWSTYITSSPYVYVCSSRTTTGTGLKVDGALATGNKSMVSAQFTQINVGGIGFHVLNDGYAQLVSMFGIFCDTAFLAESGGTASMGNCNVNFGNRGLASDGKGALIMTANVSTTGQIADFTLNLNNISVNTDPYMSVSANVPYIGLIGYFDGDTSGTYYVVVSSTVPTAGNTIVTLRNSLDNVFVTGTNISFYQQSQLRASGQTFEFVGAGITLTSALPRNGGIPNNQAQIVRTNDGAVFCTSTNENGDFQVSDLIIEQATGTVSGRTFSKSLYAEMTPFILALEG